MIIVRRSVTSSQLSHLICLFSAHIFSRGSSASLIDGVLVEVFWRVQVAYLRACQSRWVRVLFLVVSSDAWLALAGYDLIIISEPVLAVSVAHYTLLPVVAHCSATQSHTPHVSGASSLDNICVDSHIIYSSVDIAGTPKP